MNAPLRLGERDARTLLWIQAVEETDPDGVLLTPRAREAATRRAFDDPAGGDDARRLLARARWLKDDLAAAAPVLGRALDPPRWWGAAVLGVIAAATAAGAMTNVFGAQRRLSVLAFPLAGILLWNLAVYAVLLAQAARRATAPPRRAGAGRLAAAGKWLEGAAPTRPAGSAPSAAIAAAAERFQLRWSQTAAPLRAARARMVLHLAAMAMALGAGAGMYASGLAFEYRATWESTWLSATAVQRYLDLVLGPAAWALGVAVPDVAPIRGPGGDGNAEPWIHLWGATLGLFVLIPRAALALAAGLNAAYLARRLAVRLDADYARRALHAGRGAATVVEVVYYSCAPEPALRARLHAMLRDRAGARAVIREAGSLEYGDGPEGLDLAAPPATGLVAVVLPLAQTPEAEVHGEFLEGLRDRLDAAGWEMAVVLETATYRKRTGSDARVRERREAWERLLRDLRLAAIDLAAPEPS